VTQEQVRTALSAALWQYRAKLLPRSPTQKAFVEIVALCDGGTHLFWTDVDYSVVEAVKIARDAYDAKLAKAVGEWRKRQHKPIRRGAPCDRRSFSPCLT
jgi:hypothetical protein